MRSAKLVPILPIVAVLALAGCKEEGAEGPLPACRQVSTMCSADADCCSFGCVAGWCAPNPLESGVCLTSDDCQYPRVCVDQRCTSSVTCRPSGTCSFDSQCCSGDCTTGAVCAADLPPIAVAGADVLADRPFRIPFILDGAGSYDQNAPALGSSGLVFSWTVDAAPAGSAALPTPPTSPTPTFTPDVASTTASYVIRLTVTKGALSSTDTVTFKAVDTPPVITMPADVPPGGVGGEYQSRNVPLPFSATVSDADGGPVTCAWSKTSPSDVTTEVSGPAACAGASGTAASGVSSFTLNEDEAGTWELTLTASDGVNTVSRSRFVSVQNDTPVPNAGPKRYGNYSGGAIPLNGSATDVNGDVTGGNVGDGDFTWRWTVSAVPEGSGSLLLGHEVGTTPSVSFVPDEEGTYTLTLTVDDHHAGPNPSSASATVEVQVDPYVLPLGQVADAEYVDATDRIVVVDTDGGNTHQLRIVDPATLAVEYVVPLAARPSCVSLDPSGQEALVCEAGGRFERVTGLQTGTPAVATTVPATAGVALAADLVDVAHAGACAYGVTASGAVYRLHPTATGATGPYWADVSCPTCTVAEAPAGTRVVTATATATTAAGPVTAPWLWILQTNVTGRLGRYEIHGNCDLRTPSVRSDAALAGKMGLWLSADKADLVSAWTTVYDALDASLATRALTPLPLVPIHLETTFDGVSLLAAAADDTPALSTFSRGAVGSAFTTGADKLHPVLGHDGDAKPNHGRFAFVRSGGGAYYGVVRANVGTDAAPVYRWGVVNLGP